MTYLLPFSIISFKLAIQNCLELLSASHMFIDNLQDENICRLIFPVMQYFKWLFLLTVWWAFCCFCFPFCLPFFLIFMLIPCPRYFTI